MPVGTQASVKALAAGRRSSGWAREIILGNTYHLALRPGRRADRARSAACTGSWAGRAPILTDSGGFQVFSLRERRKIDDDGVDVSRRTSTARRSV